MRTFIVVAVTVALIAVAGTGRAADSNTLTVTASVTPTCKFSSATSTLGFGALDPSVGTDVNASNTTQFWCTKGVTTDAVSAGNGLNFAAGKRGMRDTVSSDVIPYSLTLTKDANPNAGPTAPRTLTLAGTVLGTDYSGKAAGSYSDTVTITLTP
jgi:spore coat protein U-like protein